MKVNKRREEKISVAENVKKGKKEQKTKNYKFVGSSQIK
jgi:hypothetical protein